MQAEIDALKAVVDRTNPESMSDSDIDELKAGKEKLMESAQNVFQKMYEGAQAAGAGPDMGGTGSGMDGASQGNAGADDDVVDGDYREV